MTMTTTSERPNYDAAVLARMGELIDRVMTIDIKGRGTVGLFYDALRSRTGAPLALEAAQRIAKKVGKGDFVVLATGFPVRPWISGDVGETDGPPGVVALCRAISAGLGAIPVVTAPAGMRAQVEKSLLAGGVLPLTLDEARRAATGLRPTCVAVVLDYTTDRAEAEAFAERIMAEVNPVFLAAVEHPGANAEGVYHSSVGFDISEGAAKIEPLFALARERGVLTMSFIDMPNEIGAGVLLDLAHEKIPFAKTCVCPCGGGTAGVSHVDHVVVGTTVNWAAYATVAGLAILLGRADLAASREHDARTIEAVMHNGGIEGVTGSIWPEAGVDGISTRISGHIVDLLAEVVANAAHYQSGKPF